MERFIITLDESGTLHVPDVSSTFIWMDEPELVTVRSNRSHAPCGGKGSI